MNFFLGCWVFLFFWPPFLPLSIPPVYFWAAFGVFFLCSIIHSTCLFIQKKKVCFYRFCEVKLNFLKLYYSMFHMV